MDYEYKCVGAPEKPRRSRRAKTGSQRLAVAMEEIIQEEAVNGWEYMRTDLVPVIEKTSMLSRPHEVHRAVLVFRRELAPRRSARPARGRREDDYDDVHEESLLERRSARRRPPQEEVYEPEPDDRLTAEEPPRRRAVPAEDPIRLTAEDMVDAMRPRRGRDREPPSGLG